MREVSHVPGGESGDRREREMIEDTLYRIGLKLTLYLTLPIFLVGLILWVVKYGTQKN